MGNIPVLNFGILPVFNMEHKFVAWLEPGVDLAIESTMIVITQFSSIIIAILGIGLAYMIYYPRSKAIVKFPTDKPAFEFEVSEPDGIAKTQNSFRKGLKESLTSCPVSSIAAGRHLRQCLAKRCRMAEWSKASGFEPDSS